VTTGGLISVVIPAFNAERYLGEAVESAFGQTYQPVEVVVVDDGSDDGTGAVARAYGDRIVFASQPNGGIGSARNRGVALARGSYLAFLDADDRFLPDKLERQFAALAADLALDMVFGHVREFVSPELAPEDRAALRGPSPPGPFVAPNAMLIRRGSFDRVGLFATDVRVGEGVDWYARATEAGLKGLTLPDVVVERRLHDSNTGIRERDSRSDYLQVVRSALERRRAPGP
jgi:glycosyltransferase involved in cell wall biosynthesis